uniref:Meiosis-specific, MEI4 homolog (S. cerevisiae) n=1 Tax=Oryzias melastigma TaxID=30732 RepID=A0A3B3DVY9_ORYME
MEAKIAVAVAIIKSKPPGVSGREHARALSIRLRRQEESWKDRVQSLEQELLRLRQDNLIRRMTSNSTSSGCIEAAGESLLIRVDATSEDLFCSGTLSCSADLQPNAFTQDSKLATPTPAGRQLPFSQTHDSHVRFLRSLCGLQQLQGNSQGQEALWFGYDGEMCSVFADTVCQLLDSVVAACRHPPAVGPTDLVSQACQVAARALDLFCSQRRPSVELRSRVEEPLRELTRMLLHSKQPSRVSNGIHGDAVFTCMKYSFFTVAIMTTCECSEPDSFPLDYYLNSCQLFWILESLLQRSGAKGRMEESGSNLTSLLGQLERRVFLLSDEFPLFSMYMYRIKDFLSYQQHLE